MKYVHSGGMDISSVVAGCMRIGDMDEKQIGAFVDTALSMGINMFDHADIYGRGKCETVFGGYLARNKSLREKMILQSKCGIVPKKRYDFSKKHILESVDGSLARLNTDYLDILLLHRPDTLMEPDEVAAAFESLSKSGKVRHFGVSNFNPMQIELLKSALPYPLMFNQLQFSAAFTPMVDAGMWVNTGTPNIVRDGGLLEYCRLHKIVIQAWSPYQKGFFGGVFIGDPEYKDLNDKLNELAEKYGVTATGIAAAFILRHPATRQIITGTTRPERLVEIANGADITLTGDEWYEIYLAAGNKIP